MNTENNNPSSVPLLNAECTLGSAVDQITEVLDASGLSFGHGTESAEQEAVWLVLHACKAETDEDVHWHRIVKADERKVIESCLSRRVQSKKPMAYVLGQAWFAGLSFHVDERVLVPRSFLSEWVPDQFSPWIDPSTVKSVLDMCCGSGCIGISTAIAMEQVKVVLSDVSQDALAVAKINIERHHLSDRVSTHCGDRFEGIDCKFDLILCNPPYVSDQRMATLPDEFRSEPEIGLRAGADGLDFIRPFMAEVRSHLSDHGHVIVEAGSASVAVEKAWPDVPFTWLGTEHDEMVLYVIGAEELDRYRSRFQSVPTDES
ncbi:MAG: 50S ribosomal protein L3 N(5)-glutamine methyltransferase [bacterium]